MTVRPVLDQLCAQWVAKDPSFPHADSEDWSDWADAQGDLSLRWAHSHFVGFVMRRLNYVLYTVYLCQYILLKLSRTYGEHP